MSSVAAGIVGAAGSLIGGTAGAKATYNNQVRLMQYQNKLQQDQYNREVQEWYNQQKYTQQAALEQWNRENEYNSPVAQKERWRQAGLNPFFMNGNTGTASDVASTMAGNGSVPSGSSPQIPAPQDMSYYGNAINQFIDRYYQNEMMSRQMESMDLDNAIKAIEEKYREKSIIQDLAEKAARTSDLSYSAAIKMYERDFLRDTFTERVKQVGQQSDINELNKTLLDQHRQLNEIGLTYADAQAQALLNNTIADTALKVASRKLTLEQAATEVQKRILMQAETEGIKLTNEFTRQTWDVSKRLVKAEAQKTEAERSLVSKTVKKLFPQTVKKAEFENSTMGRYGVPLINGFGTGLGFAAGSALVNRGFNTVDNIVSGYNNGWSQPVVSGNTVTYKKRGYR